MLAGGRARPVLALFVVQDIEEVQIDIEAAVQDVFQLHIDSVRREADRYGVEVLEIEIIGLTPQAAIVSAAEHYLKLERFSTYQFLENRLRESE